MTDHNAIIEKIKKLFAKANDKSVSEAEAEMFMKKVQELLAEHNLSEDVLGQVDHEPINTEMYPIKYNGSWFHRVALMVSHYYFADVYRTTMSDKSKVFLDASGFKYRQVPYYAFVGKKHHRMVAIQMFEYAVKTFERLAKDKGMEGQNKTDFFKGACVRMAHRLYLEIEARKAPSVNNPGNLPALIDAEKKAIEEYLSDIKMKKANKTNLKGNRTAFEAGVNAANGVSLTTQVHGATVVAGLLK